MFKGRSDIFSNLGAIKINEGELTLGPKVTQTGFQVTQQTGSALESDEEWTRETGSKNKNDLLQRIDSETGNLTHTKNRLNILRRESLSCLCSGCVLWMTPSYYHTKSQLTACKTELQPLGCFTETSCGGHLELEQVQKLMSCLR